MNRRYMLPNLFFILYLSSVSSAHQTSGSTNSRIPTILHLSRLTSRDWQVLFSEADSGNAEAQYWLGRIYGQGILLSKDSQKSAEWYQRSAEHDYAPAEYAVCLAHANGDSNESNKCMRSAAEKGVPEAQFWLGVAHQQIVCSGIREDDEALKWFKQAAERGNPDGQVELGQHYEDGRGVEQDYGLAAYWYRRAAEHVPDLGGARQGRNNLGNLYMAGLGVPKDYVQAYMWFSLAGIEAQVAKVKVHMTPSQIVQAQQITDEWKKQHPDPAIY